MRIQWNCMWKNTIKGWDLVRYVLTYNACCWKQKCQFLLAEFDSFPLCCWCCQLSMYLQWILVGANQVSRKTQWCKIPLLPRRDTLALQLSLTSRKAGQDNVPCHNQMCKTCSKLWPNWEEPTQQQNWNRIWCMLPWKAHRWAHGLTKKVRISSGAWYK